MARPVSYGQVSGSNFASPFLNSANLSFVARSGKFVALSASYIGLAGAASVTDIVGWALSGETSYSATAGKDEISVITDRNAVFEMPISNTMTRTELQARVGLTCDLYLTGGKQYASPTSSTYDQLQIVGYKYYGSGDGEQSVLVKLRPCTPTQTGVV